MNTNFKKAIEKNKKNQKGGIWITNLENENDYYLIPFKCNCRTLWIGFQVNYDDTCFDYFEICNNDLVRFKQKDIFENQDFIRINDIFYNEIDAEKEIKYEINKLYRTFYMK